MTATTNPFRVCVGCASFGRGDEGYPICRHPDAHVEGITDGEIPVLSLETCPTGRWRRINGVRVPRDQMTLGGAP